MIYRLSCVAYHAVELHDNERDERYAVANDDEDEVECGVPQLHFR